MEVRKIALALRNDHQGHIVFTTNDFLFVCQILFAVDIRSEPGVFSLSAHAPVSIIPFPKRVSYGAFQPGEPLL